MSARYATGEGMAVALEMLGAAPTGKLAIADLQLTNREEVQELERAGCDAVIVHAHDVFSLVGVPPPPV